MPTPVDLIHAYLSPVELGPERRHSIDQRSVQSHNDTELEEPGQSFLQLIRVELAFILAHLQRLHPLLLHQTFPSTNV
jgi:hypothetical protein